VTCSLNNRATPSHPIGYNLANREAAMSSATAIVITLISVGVSKLVGLDGQGLLFVVGLSFVGWYLDDIRDRLKKIQNELENI
jgi:hypothetical protein